MEQIDEESAVLGACLQSAGAWAEVCVLLSEPDFYHEPHRLIWKAMAELHSEGAPISEITVSSKLRQHECISRVGGATYVRTLVDQLQDIGNVGHYATLVKGYKTGRRVKSLGKYLSTSTDPPEEKIGKAYAELGDIAKKSVISKVKTLGESADEFMFDLLDENGVIVDPIKTGFSDLDDSLWGLQPEDYCILASRPSIGKTAFSMQVAMNAAKQNRSILFLSLEMATSQLMRRILSAESGVSYQRILKSQHLSSANKEALREAAARIKTLPLDIDESSSQVIGSVRMKAQQAKAQKGGLDMIIIDYLQLLCKDGDSYEEATRVSNGLKAIAKDLGIVVWANSQLSRAIEYRESRRPQLSDLRSSGSLEQDADQVIFLWHHLKGRDGKVDKTKTQALLEKHRNGPLGAATLLFDRNTTRFSKGSW